MLSWLADVGSALEFTVTVLLLITCLVSIISAVLVPKSVTAEVRFEKRLEYTVFAIGALVLLALLLLAPR